MPLAKLYGLISTLKQHLARPVATSVPVICVGNLTAGGAGKTPVALLIGGILTTKKLDAFFLSRGYGGMVKGPLLVDPNFHTAREVGDEPLLLARVLPTVISADRIKGAKYAIEQGAKIIVMDDGFQNTSIQKTLSLLVIDGEIGFGNGRLLPAGPLRELPEAGFKRADAVIVINSSDATPILPEGMLRLDASIRAANGAFPPGKKLLAFCGLAYPQKFFDTLRSLGAEIVETVSFPDHYDYRSGDMKNLSDKALRHKATLVTTAKDAVRLAPEWRSLVTVVDITLEIEEPERLTALLEKALA